MKRPLVLFSTFLLSLCLSNAWGDVTLPAIFGNHMVLQQKKSVAVWGWAEPGEAIKVKGDWQWFAASTKADADGKWSVKIRTPKAGGPHTLTITGNNEIVLDDVLMGEVWICSGQSNMEFTPRWLGDESNLKTVAESANPQIRLFEVANEISTTPRQDCEGSWTLCEPETVMDFSAVGYYFGKELNEALDVPIGLISSNWGGTPAETWTRREALLPFEQFAEKLDYLKDPVTASSKLKATFEQAMVNWENELAALDEGTRDGWQTPGLDESDWTDMEQPGKWSQSETELKDVDGIVWFRRTTNLPPSWAKHDLELHLGPVDDIDTVWVNGVKIGTTTDSWIVPRKYLIPASVLKVGKNTIAVRIIDNQGDGGFASDNADDMRIGPAGADVKACATLAKTWKYKISHQGRIPNAPQSTLRIDQNSPTTLYNGMLAPLIPFRIAGAIWYQGEANRNESILYRELFPAMISNWRQDWGQGKFPFYFVQIAPFEYNDSFSSGGLREAQMMTLDKLDNVGMAVTMDIGEAKDIHPKNKVDVGNRLARWALAKTYKKKGIVYSGPLYKSMKIEGDKIRLSFDYVDGGLMAKDGDLTDFTIAGEDRKFVKANAVIDGGTIVVSSPAVKNPAAVRYGWADWCQPNLFNSAGLPASSFRTDDWPL